MVHPQAMFSFWTAYPGESAALLAAVLWAISSQLYKRAGAVLSPLRLNLLKNVVAGVLLLITLVATGASWAGLDARAAALLAASGLVGIGIGDTFYLAGMNAIGPRRILLLETLAPPVAALLAWLFLGEHLGGRDWLAMALTLAGVAWVISERTPDILQTPGLLKKGLIAGIGAAVCQATGAVMSRAVLDDQVLDPMVSALIRITSGMLFPLAALAWLKGRRVQRTDRRPLDVRTAAIAAAAIVMGTYFGIWLQQVALRHTEAGIAQTLVSTCPLWILPIAVLLGEKVSVRAVLGALLAFSGVTLLFM